MITESGIGYMAMCLKAIEIQENWQPKENDLMAIQYMNEERYTIIRPHKPCSVFDVYELQSYIGERYHFVIWLPRQEDLQKIYKVNFMPDTLRSMLKDFKSFVWRNSELMSDEFDVYPMNECMTMEQLWLCFIMKILYGKIWEDGNWIKVD